MRKIIITGIVALSSMFFVLCSDNAIDAQDNGPFVRPGPVVGPIIYNQDNALIADVDCDFLAVGNGNGSGGGWSGGGGRSRCYIGLVGSDDIDAIAAVD
ncbi:MAG: hypothetical protein HY606_05955 [Planctomycetes bacterium]|nr:hypothetical protein [Planctomycetota bacterium]